MHKIISTTGAPIEFTLTSEKSFVIDPVTPIEVTDEELISLLERLGNQISEVSEEKDEPIKEEATVKANVDDGSVEKEAKVDPIIKNYKVLDEEGVIAPDGSTIAKDGVVELDSLDENTISLLSSGAIEEEIPQA